MPRTMSPEREREYAELHAYLDYFSTHISGIDPSDPIHPTNVGRGIVEKYGRSKALDGLKQAVNDAGVKRFGSGWTWLIHDGTGLAVLSTPNQDSPLMSSDVPLLGIDVWEHAYYLKYQNRRPDYLEAWWNVVNWDAVGARLDAVT